MSQTTIILSKLRNRKYARGRPKEDEKANITGIKKERKSLRSGEKSTDQKKIPKHRESNMDKALKRSNIKSKLNGNENYPIISID